MTTSHHIKQLLIILTLVHGIPVNGLASVAPASTISNSVSQEYQTAENYLKDQNYKAAIPHLERIIASGKSEFLQDAYIAIAFCYLSFKTDKDNQQAIHYLQKTNSFPAPLILTLLYARNSPFQYKDVKHPDFNRILSESTIKQDLNQAEKYLLITAKAANKPIPPEQVGLFYAKFNDYAKARLWLEKGAKQGSARAQNNLAALYQKGLGGSVDSDKAVAYYTASASQGMIEALGNLGILFYKGEGVKRNLTYAVAFLTLTTSVAKTEHRELYQRYLNLAQNGLSASEIKQAQLIVTQLKNEPAVIKKLVYEK